MLAFAFWNWQYSALGTYIFERSPGRADAQAEPENSASAQPGDMEQFIASCIEAVNQMPFSPGDGNNWRCAGSPGRCTTPSGRGASSFWKDMTSLNVEKMRLRGLPDLGKEDIVVDVGGNLGEDTKWLVQHSTGQSLQALYVFEALPEYQDHLKKTFAKHRAVHVQDYGLGSTDAIVQFDVEQGASKPSSGGRADTKSVQVQIRNVTKVLGELGIRNMPIKLWTMNCEGCEYPVISSLVEDMVVERIEMLQFATHYLPDNGFSGIQAKYCRAVEKLRWTHRMAWGVPWCWERWIRLLPGELPDGLAKFSFYGGWGHLGPTAGMLVSTGYWSLRSKRGKPSASDAFYQSRMSVPLNMPADFAVYGDADGVAAMKRVGFLTTPGGRRHAKLISATKVGVWQFPPCSTHLCDPVASIKANACVHSAVANISQFAHGVHVPSIELGCVWHGKLDLLERSARAHPEYEFHMWLDVACQADVPLNPDNPEWANKESLLKLPRDRVAVSTWNSDCEKCRDGWSYCHCVTGGNYIVPTRLLNHMHNLYTDQLNKCMVTALRDEIPDGRFVCMSDQVILTKLFLENPNLFSVIGAGWCGVATALSWR